MQEDVHGLHTNITPLFVRDLNFPYKGKGFGVLGKSSILDPILLGFWEITVYCVWSSSKYSAWPCLVTELLTWVWMVLLVGHVDRGLRFIRGTHSDVLEGMHFQTAASATCPSSPGQDVLCVLLSLLVDISLTSGGLRGRRHKGCEVLLWTVIILILFQL